jgi:tRNA pseudouridine38-40 synthase
MVAHVDIATKEFRMPHRKLRLALNAYLPEDIRVREAVPCSPEFHARFDSIGKQYRYYVWNHPAMNPLLRRQAWHVPVLLDRKAMRLAAGYFVGTHDFRSLAANRDYEVENTCRTLSRCSLRASGSLLTFVMEGDGFLYKMCRAIVGTLVQVGKGKYPAARVGDMLEAKDRRVAGMTAPAQGLVLWRVLYPESEEDPSP